MAGAWGWQPHHLHVPNVMKSRSLNLLEPSGPHRACNRTALPLPQLTISMELSLACGILVFQLVEKFSALYGTRRSIAVFARARHLICLLCGINSVHALPAYFFNTHLNISLPFTPTSAKYAPTFRFAYQILLHYPFEIQKAHPPETFIG
jgi:hypothetical protein